MMASYRFFRVFLHCLSLGFSKLPENKIMFAGIFVVYSAIMLIYSGIIRMIPVEDLRPLMLSHDQMIWYMGTTEFVLFSASGWVFKEVQNDFLSGQSDLALLRPFPDASLRVAFWMGQALPHTLILFPGYFVLMYLIVGSCHMGLFKLLGVFLSVPLACFMMFVAAYAIGASCLWFVQAEPASWVWAKAVFLFSAMVWPIVFYPDWLQIAVWFTPFPGILTLAGNMALDMPLWRHGVGFLHQFFWAFLFFKSLPLFDRIILRRLQRGQL